MFYNYRSTVHELTLQGVANLTNINFHKAKQKLQVYIFGGIGAFTYSTFYKTLDQHGNPYDYTAILNKYGPNQSGSSPMPTGARSNPI